MTGLILLLLGFLFYAVTVYLSIQSSKDMEIKNSILYSLFPSVKVKLRIEFLYTSVKWLAIIWFSLGILLLYLENKELMGPIAPIILDPSTVFITTALLWILFVTIFAKRYPFE
jgi:hypothetical protein